MRIKLFLTAWLLALTLAWLAVAPADAGFFPLVNDKGWASGWWQWRLQAIYLTGLWSLGLMSLIMVLALRLPVVENLLGGMDRVYRLHKWAGIGAAVTALMHWGAKEAGGLIKTLWGREGKPARDAVLPWFTDARGFAKDLGEWAFYLLLAMVVLTLVVRLLSYKNWQVLHRAMALLYLAFVFHAVALTPLSQWAPPLGLLQAALLALGSAAALWSLAGKIGQRRRYSAQVHAVQALGAGDGAPLQVDIAVESPWPGHRAGQFAFVRFELAEGHHPFTIASAPGALGQDAQGRTLLRLIIKPLGDYTASLQRRLRQGQAVDIEGPYGHFDGQGSAERQQVWIAGGVGVTPFLALLQARQAGQSTTDGQAQPVQMHYCTRDAVADPLVARLQTLCAQAQPPVRLSVHDDAQGQRLTPQRLAQSCSGAVDIWFCGPQGLGDVLDAQARRAPWRIHREFFAMR